MIYAVVALSLVSAAGWFFAWRSRGETNKANDRARLAEAHAESAEGRTFAAESSAAVAQAQARAANMTLIDVEQELAAARAERSELLERIAKLGVPVGDVLFDSTLDRLYKDRDRTGGGQGPGPSGDQDPVSVSSAGSAAPGAKEK